MNIGIALRKSQSRSDENDNDDNNNNNNDLNILEYNRTREKELQQPSQVFTDVAKTAASKGRPRTYSIESHFGMRDPQTEFSQWMCDDPMWWNENLHIQIDSDEDAGATSAAEKDFSEDIFFSLSVSAEHFFASFVRRRRRSHVGKNRYRVGKTRRRCRSSQGWRRRCRQLRRRRRCQRAT